MFTRSWIYVHNLYGYRQLLSFNEDANTAAIPTAGRIGRSSKEITGGQGGGRTISRASRVGEKKNMRCTSLEESLDFMAKLDGILGEFETPGDMRTEQTQGAAFCLG